MPLSYSFYASMIEIVLLEKNYNYLDVKKKTPKAEIQLHMKYAAA